MRIKINGTFKELTPLEVDNYRTYIQRLTQRGNTAKDIADVLKIGRTAVLRIEPLADMNDR